MTTKGWEKTASAVERYIAKVWRRDVASTLPSSCQTSSEQYNEAWPADEEYQVESQSTGVGQVLFCKDTEIRTEIRHMLITTALCQDTVRRKVTHHWKLKSGAEKQILSFLCSAIWFPQLDQMCLAKLYGNLAPWGRSYSFRKRKIPIINGERNKFYKTFFIFSCERWCNGQLNCFYKTCYGSLWV